MLYKARICDICLENTAERDKSLRVKRYSHTYMNYDTIEPLKWERLDVCPECAELFYQFVRDMKKGELK